MFMYMYNVIYTGPLQVALTCVSHFYEREGDIVTG